MPEHAPPEIGNSLTTLLRAVHKMRERVRLSSHRHGVDWSAYSLLRPVVEGGPQRVTALADAVHLTPSTVSRLVTHLIAAGLLERRADAGDGRACIVAPTAAGVEAYAELRRVRDAYVDRLLQDWSAHDRAELARLLARLAAAIEADAGPGTPSGRAAAPPSSPGAPPSSPGAPAATPGAGPASSTQPSATSSLTSMGTR